MAKSQTRQQSCANRRSTVGLKCREKSSGGGRNGAVKVPCALWDFQLLAQYDTVDGTPVLMTL